LTEPGEGLEPEGPIFLGRHLSKFELARIHLFRARHISSTLSGQFENNVFVWGGAMVGHHAKINDNCWLTGGCLIGGGVDLGEGSFVGMGAILGQEVKTGAECMFGAGTLTIRSLGNNAVVVAEQTEIHRLNSQQFIRMSSCFRM